MEFSYSFNYDAWQDDYDTIEEALDALSENLDTIDRPLDKYLEFGGYENRVDTINNQRPLFEDILASDVLAPQGLQLLERMLTETPSRFSKRDLELLRHRGEQITAVNDERIMELASSEDAEVSARALRLIYAAGEKLYHDAQGAFMTDNLMRFAWNVALNPDIELHKPKYATESLISCVGSKDKEVASAAVRAAHDVMYTPETTGFGTAVYEGLIEYAFRDDKAFGSRQEIIDLYKTRPELLDYKLKIGDYLRLLSFRDVKADDPIQVLLDVDAFYTQAKTDPAMMEAFQRSVGVYVARPQPSAKLSVLNEYWMRSTGHVYKTYTEAWNGGCGDKMRPQAYEDRNIEAMAAIELIEPGAVKVLTEEFGIRSFMRYPTSTMINQYRNRDNEDLEYGVYIMPRTDHNSAFHPSNSQAHLMQTFEQGLAQADAGMRIYEASDTIDVLRTVYRARHRYDKQLRFAVISGHGSANSLQIDENDVLRGYVYTWNVRSLANRRTKRLGYEPSKRLADAFADDAVIILDSCSTGTRDGIMDEFSDLLDITAFAPVSPSKLMSIGVDPGDTPGSFALRPKYRDPTAMASSVRFRQTK